MKIIKAIMPLLLLYGHVIAQSDPLVLQARKTMKEATRYMMDSISTRGGFVWYYLPDKSRRWGEMEAYPSMIWVQDGGTVSVGNTLLDAFATTQDEFYYQAALKTANALIAGQSTHGGWNYMIDFNGETSIRKWYATIGKNGWRLEEFQHYYGNDTFDDDVTSAAARFLLRIWQVKQDVQVKKALDKAIAFVRKSQYPNGGWPQRYPLKYDFSKSGRLDYSSFHTFNDDVIWENLNFLIQCREVLNDTTLTNHIRKGMDFYVLSQKPNGAWGQQYDTNLNVAGARSYEPAAYLPRATFANSMLLMRFFRMTGDERYLKPIPKAIEWLEKVKLPPTDNGRITHSLFVDVATEKPIYVHRRGSNVKYGRYYVDTTDARLLAHMSGKNYINIEALKKDYARHLEMKVNSSLLSESLIEPSMAPRIADNHVKRILASIDSKWRWLEKHVMISHPYRGDGVLRDPTNAFASTHVGDNSDTSPFRDPSEQEYISTPAYIRNMQALISFVKSREYLPVVWKMNNKNNSGTFRTTVSGEPKLIVAGKDSSLFFDGVDDGLFVPDIPIRSWRSFTIDVRIRPDGKGPKEPRFLHFEDSIGNRGTLEARITADGRWYLDVFLKNGKTGDRFTIIDSTLTHPVDQWYTVALAYDGEKMYSYVNGKKEHEAPLVMMPFSSGSTAIGVRLNKVNWFRGQISTIIFYPYHNYHHE